MITFDAPPVASALPATDAIGLLARRLTAQKLIREFSGQRQLPQEQVEAIFADLPVNLMILLDFPEGLTILGCIIAGVLGLPDEGFYHPTVH